MHFFIPGILPGVDPEKLWQEIRTWEEGRVNGWKITERRIYAIKFEHNGQRRCAMVGDRDEKYHRTVVAIMESNAFLVFLRDGDRILEPYLVGKNEALSIEDFEGLQK